MNFGEIIKTEIKNKQIKDKHCKLAFLAGLVRSSGVLYYENDSIGIMFKVPDEQTAMLCSNLLKLLFNYDVREVSVSSNDKFTININGTDTIKILSELGVILFDENNQSNFSINFSFYNKIAEKDCCFKSFLRGLFIGSGGCTVPDNNGGKTGFHLELNFSHSIPASETLNRLNENKINCKITHKKDNYMLYIKKAEEIKDFIAFIGAPLSVLKLTEIIIERELYNKTNRIKNCDLGNVNKQIEAVSKQVNAIKIIDKMVGLSTLKEDLYLTAKFRLENLEDTLAELANKLEISKSCLNHRLRKIVSYADTLVNKNK